MYCAKLVYNLLLILIKNVTVLNNKIYLISIQKYLSTYLDIKDIIKILLKLLKNVSKQFFKVIF